MAGVAVVHSIFILQVMLIICVLFEAVICSSCGPLCTTVNRVVPL